MPNLNEKYDQSNLSWICGGLGGLAIMYDGISTKTAHGINDNLDICSLSKTQDKDDVSLVKKQKTWPSQTWAVKTCNNFHQSRCWRHPLTS